MQVFNYFLKLLLLFPSSKTHTRIMTTEASSFVAFSNTSMSLVQGEGEGEGEGKCDEGLDVEWLLVLILILQVP